MENEFHGRPKRRNWVALFVAAILVVVTLGYAYYIHETDRIRLQKYDEITGIANLKTESIQNWRKRLLSDVLELSRGPFWKRAVNDWLREPSRADLLTGLRDRLVVGQKQGEYADALLVDLDGNVIASASGQTEGINTIEKKVIEETLASGSPVLSDLYRTPHGAILMDSVAPVLDTNGRSIAVAIYRTSPESVLFPLIQTWPTPSQTAETLLIRKDDADALYLNELRHRPNTALLLREPLKRHSLPAAQAVSGKTGFFQGKDYRGVEVLANLHPVPDSPWFMVAKVDISEILAEAHYRGAVVIIFSILFIFLAAGFTAYGYRNRQVKLYQNLYKSESEERKSQEALKESEERHRSLLEHLPQRIFIKDRNSVYLSCNKNYASDLGIAPEQIVGKDDFEFHPPELAQAYRSDDQACMNTGVVKDVEEPYQLQGQERWAHTIKVPYRDGQGRVIGVMGIFEDITERKAAEQAVQRSENFLDQIVENLPDMVFVKDAEALRFVRFNKAGEDLLGYSQEDLLGKNDYDFFPLEQADFFIRKDKEVLASGKLLEIDEEEIDTRLKGKRTLHTKKIPILDSNGASQFLLGISEDITERKRLEEERTNLIVELQNALAQVKTLSGFLPICSSCKKIRDDKGYWNEIERYIGEHSETQFSHGICPDCARKLYPELFEDPGDVPQLK